MGGGYIHETFTIRNRTAVFISSITVNELKVRKWRVKLFLMLYTNYISTRSQYSC